MNLYVSIEYDREQIVIFFYWFRKFGNRAKKWRKNGNGRKKWRKFGNATPPVHPHTYIFFVSPCIVNGINPTWRTLTYEHLSAFCWYVLIYSCTMICCGYMSSLFRLVIICSYTCFSFYKHSVFQSEARICFSFS